MLIILPYIKDLPLTGWKEARYVILYFIPFLFNSVSPLGPNLISSFTLFVGGGFLAIGKTEEAHLGMAQTAPLYLNKTNITPS